MRLAAPTRLTLRAALLIAAGLLAACGSARKVAEERPLCQRCHGGTSGNAAPPTSVSGATLTADPKVGAHQAHVVAGRLRGPIACSECHVVPADMKAHEAGIAAIAAGTASRVTFGPLAAKDTTTAAWNSAAGKCGNTYCHGATMNHGGTNQNPSWTAVDAGHTEAACGTCHFMKGAITTVFPAGHPLGNDNCVACHPQTLTDNATINIAGGKHMNGEIDGGCNGCHAAPPADRGHQIHATASAVIYGDTRITADFLTASATTYAFGCGNCHPLDFSAHAVHTTGTPSLVPIIDLSPAGAPAGSLRSRNDPGASYDSAAKTCAGVYCHSTGQATPAFKVSAPWNGPYPTEPERCAKCHGNPPNYASGTAGSATANGHVALVADGSYEWGHFAGLPGVSHDNSAHGGTLLTSGYYMGESAAPITCQTCHYQTANPANTGPSKFYYLDTTGDYELGGTITYAYSCTSCHDGSPATGTGSVMPYFHVNGTRDVDFDPRTDLTGIDPAFPLPAGPNAPTRPYWFTKGAPPLSSMLPLPADATTDGTTLSLHLGSATWNAGSKTCGSVACHFKQVSVQWGGEMGTAAACATCHPM